MADWPTLAQLKARLDLGDDISDDLEDIVENARLSGIYKVKTDVGRWDDYEDVPDESLSFAALRMAELIATSPEQTPGTLAMDRTYERAISGHRRRFGFA